MPNMAAGRKTTRHEPPLVPQIQKSQTIAHDKENINYMCKVYADIDRAAELDVRSL